MDSRNRGDANFQVFCDRRCGAGRTILPRGRNAGERGAACGHQRASRPYPCRKLKLEHIGGVAHPTVAPESRGLRFGRRAG
jgi:hypothetical protein